MASAHNARTSGTMRTTDFHSGRRTPRVEVAARQEAAVACDFCDSRAELVNRAIHLDAENRHLRKLILELQTERGEDQNVSLVGLLLGRIAALEANVQRMAAKRSKAA